MVHGRSLGTVEYARFARRLSRRLSMSTHPLPPSIVNGSFVTTKPNPNDLDLIVVMPPDSDLQAELTPGLNEMAPASPAEAAGALRENGLPYDPSRKPS